MMTDNEIIKALECCANNPNECVCYENKCPLFGQKCIDILSKNALDLINRQQAEIERLKDILYDADGVNLVNYWHQQCKIAENGCRNFEEENENLKAEIERLCMELDEVIIAKDLLFDEAEALIKKTKAEAVKEFAERLKETSSAKKYNLFVTKDDIDNLVKEMAGEEK